MKKKDGGQRPGNGYQVCVQLEKALYVHEQDTGVLIRSNKTLEE